ncbi:hypothetical protein [Jannaschia pohangensis]|uniref:Uncharacterized protein n=1 Tax=Jannaschia pohangensis TaxID=390807 RepID=A0A1I3SLQ6_9RHOB|nr:hypothetical protein [Jannaschia pohangensis]SFJ59685.1 hypothetical protein SAMN04488095_3202 [Jannaschia pohangensis]
MISEDDAYARAKDAVAGEASGMVASRRPLGQSASAWVFGDHSKSYAASGEIRGPLAGNALIAISDCRAGGRPMVTCQTPEGAATLVEALAPHDVSARRLKRPR